MTKRGGLGRGLAALIPTSAPAKAAAETVVRAVAPGAAVVRTSLILGGGVFYISGAVVYGRKRPDPSPRWFGFHEIFHACTIGGFVCHYVAISLVTYAAR